MTLPERMRIAYLLPLLLLAALAACGGGSSGSGERDDATEQVKHVEGTFVGKVEKGDANLAVVAAPAERGKDSRPVTMYVSDGGRVSASLTGSATGNSFSVASEDGAAKAKGKLDGDSVSGTLTLPDGDAVAYRAKRAAAAAGLYDVTLTAKGQLSGASATGVGLSSKSPLRAPGVGRIKFADGKRRRFQLTAKAVPDPVRLGAGQLRLIVMPDGELSGAGAVRPSRGGEELDVFIRSAAR